MHGCDGPFLPIPGWTFKPVRGVPEMREIIAALGNELEKPLAMIRESLGSLPAISSESRAVLQPHLTTALAMCDDVAELNRRYLDYLEQVQALPDPQYSSVRPDELLAELDRQIMPEAFGRGIAWSCETKGPIRSFQTDRLLLFEALLEWAALAVECACSGDLVSILLMDSDEPGEDERCRITLRSSAMEIISNLSSLCEDPLFSRIVCLEEVGTDPGSRLALSLERLVMLDVEIRFERSAQGFVQAVQFLAPEVERRTRH